MIERRVAVPWINGRLAAYLELIRTARFLVWSPPIRRDGLRSDATPVPWGYMDVARTAAWTIGLATGAVIGLIVLRLLVSIVFLVGEMTWLLPENAYDNLTTNLGPYSSMLSALALGGSLYASLVYAVYRQSIAKYGVAWSSLGFVPMSGRMIGRIAILFVPVTIAGVSINLAQQALLGAVQNSSQVTVLTEGVTATSANFAMLAFLLVGVAPVAEELFFRGFLFRLLRQRLPAWATIAITALAFAALHGSPMLLPWLFFMGLVFGFVVEKTGSIFSSILLHAMVNGLTMLGIVIALSGW